MIHYGTGTVRSRGSTYYLYLPSRLHLLPGTNIIITVWPDGEEMKLDNIFRLITKVRIVNSKNGVALNLSGIPCKRNMPIAYRLEDVGEEYSLYERKDSLLNIPPIPVPEELLENVDDA